MLLITALALQSCTTVFFKEAQPKKSEALTSFPAEYLGSFTMEEDTFIIHEGHYSFPILFEKQIPMSEMSNPDFQIRDSLIYDASCAYRGGMKFSIVNDTLHYRKLVRNDRGISDSLRLKKLDKFLVVNILDRNYNYWLAYFLEKKDDDILLHTTGHVRAEGDSLPAENFDGDMADFEKITHFEMLKDDVYVIDPTEKELKKLIAKGLFPTEVQMTRIE